MGSNIVESVFCIWKQGQMQPRLPDVRKRAFPEPCIHPDGAVLHSHSGSSAPSLLLLSCLGFPKDVGPRVSVWQSLSRNCYHSIPIGRKKFIGFSYFITISHASLGILCKALGLGVGVGCSVNGVTAVVWPNESPEMKT